VSDLAILGSLAIAAVLTVWGIEGYLDYRQRRDRVKARRK
jgi:hypothetical protein